MKRNFFFIVMICTLCFVGANRMIAQNEDAELSVNSSDEQYKDYDGLVRIKATKKDSKGNVIATIDDWYSLTVRFNSENAHFVVSACNKSCPISYYEGECPKERFRQLFFETIDQYYGYYGSYSIYSYAKP